MKELYAALVKFQSLLTPVGKSVTNPYFKSKYAPLNEVVELINPLLAQCDLAVLQPMTSFDDGTPALKTIVIHVSGQSIENVTPLFLVKNDPQSHGSAVTYARRYGLMSMLGVVADEDDDGNKSSNRQTDKPQESYKAKQDTSSNGTPATIKQKVLIKKLLDEKGVSIDDMQNYLIDEYGIDGPMSSRDASFVIESESSITKNVTV